MFVNLLKVKLKKNIFFSSTIGIYKMFSYGTKRFCNREGIRII